MARSLFPGWWGNKRGANALDMGGANGTKQTVAGVCHYAWPVTWDAEMLDRLSVPAGDSGHVIYSPQRYVWQHFWREQTKRE